MDEPIPDPRTNTYTPTYTVDFFNGALLKQGSNQLVFKPPYAMLPNSDAEIAVDPIISPNGVPIKVTDSGEVHATITIPSDLYVKGIRFSIIIEGKSISGNPIRFMGFAETSQSTASQNSGFSSSTSSLATSNNPTAANGTPSSSGSKNSSENSTKLNANSTTSTQNTASSTQGPGTIQQSSTFYIVAIPIAIIIMGGIIFTIYRRSHKTKPHSN